MTVSVAGWEFSVLDSAGDMRSRITPLGFGGSGFKWRNGFLLRLRDRRLMAFHQRYALSAERQRPPVDVAPQQIAGHLANLVEEFRRDRSERRWLDDQSTKIAQAEKLADRWSRSLIGKRFARQLRAALSDD